MTMNKVEFDDYADNYDNLLKDQLVFFDGDIDYFAKYKVELVSRFVSKEPKSILEYGCGTGRNLRYLKEKFPNAKLYGCDISQKSLDLAAQNNPGVTFLKNNQSLGDQGLKFDLIVVACVLHHVAPSEREKEVGVFRKILNAAGEVFIFEHNPWNPVTRHIVRNCPFDADAVLLPPQEVAGLFKKADLQVKDTRFTLFFPAFLNKLRFLEKYMDRVPFGGQYFIKAVYA